MHGSRERPLANVGYEYVHLSAPLGVVMFLQRTQFIGSHKSSGERYTGATTVKFLREGAFHRVAAVINLNSLLT